jgi:hypothetical protein
MIIKALTIFVLLGLFAGVEQAQTFSTLKADKLYGNVKSVRREQSWTSKKGDKYVESEKSLMTADSYDKSGNKTEWLGYFGKQERPLRFTFVCDDKGKLIKELSYDIMDVADVETVYKYNADGTLAEEVVSNGLKVVYAYDSKNNKQSETTYDLAENEGGRAFGPAEKVVYFHYYKNNKLKEIAAYDLKGSRIWNPPIQAHKIVYAYNSKGETTFATVFNADNSVRSKTRYVYDSKGTPVKEFSFVAEDKTTYVYTYTYRFDERGNWIEQKKSRQISKKNSATVIPVETIYRTIVYY